MIKKIKFLAVMLFVMVATAVQAQVTTSSMSGRVTDVDGEVIGATVIATHVPTGTRYGTTTNMEGRFSITGMRVGGPYTVEVSFIGYGTHTTENITLALGQEFIHNVFLTENAQLLNELVVTGIRTRFTTERTGAATNISNRQIVSMPTVSRNVQDIIRMSPFSGGGMSLAGGDGRSTNFTIDGANFNNNMGLAATLPGGGNPVSLDALEEMQIVIAPFDVRQTNFIGGGINAVTRSGTNQLRGSAYMFHTNQEWRGNRVNDTDLGERSESRTNIYGFSIGGPIIRDRLFFFVNAETETSPGQTVLWRPSPDGVANIQQQLSRASIADMQAVRNHLIQHYGYDPGSYNNFQGDDTTHRILARLDWNINQRHRLSLRYNYTERNRWMPPNAASSDFMNWPLAGGGRTSQLGMSFSNSLYSFGHVANTWAGELNSRFTDRLSNQLLITHSLLNDLRGSTSSPFPFIDIMYGRNEAGNPIISPYISAGYELFSWNNGVRNNVFTVTNNFTAFLDNHRITAGVSYEFQRVGNAFMRAGTGHFRFASLEEFLNREAPVDFSLTYGWDGEANPMSQVAFHQVGAYVQNEWSMTPNFRLTGGFRADYIKYDESVIMRNNAVYALNFSDIIPNEAEGIFGRHIDTGAWPRARVQVSPRLGFTWDMMGDQSLRLRGGTGLFAGRLPLVFFTNQPNQSGMVQGNIILRHDRTQAERDILASLAGGLITNVDDMISRLNLPTTIRPEDGAVGSIVAGVDPDFRMPQVWKTSLALDIQIPVNFPLSVTVEGIFNNMINDVTMENWNERMPDETWQRFANPNPNNPVYDNRFIYPTTGRHFVTGVGPNNNITPQAFVLTNTNLGWGAIGNITVTASPMRNMDLMLAYTITESRELTGMPGSSANAIHQNTNTVNGPLLLDLQRSMYVVPHRVIGSFGYSTPSNTWAGNILANTHFNIFYTGASANGFSYTFTNDVNGDGFARDLIWIPRNRGDLRFINEEHEDAFFRFKAQCRYLQRNAGGYAEANAVRAPWVHRFDLRVARDFRINSNTLTFSIDVTNFGNLLNSKWGIPKNMSAANGGAILTLDNRNDIINGVTDLPVFSVHNSLLSEDATPWTSIYGIGNTWRMQFGVRYTFN